MAWGWNLVIFKVSFNPTIPILRHNTGSETCQVQRLQPGLQLHIPSLPKAHHTVLTRGLCLLQHLDPLPELCQAFFLPLDCLLMPEASASHTQVGQIQCQLLKFQAQVVLIQPNHLSTISPIIPFYNTSVHSNSCFTPPSPTSMMTNTCRYRTG